MSVTFPVQPTGRKRPINYSITFDIVVPTDNPVPDADGHIPQVPYNSLTSPYKAFSCRYDSVIGASVLVEGPIYDLIDSSGGGGIFGIGGSDPVYDGPYIRTSVYANNTFIGGHRVLQSDYEPLGTITGTLAVYQSQGFVTDNNRPGRVIFQVSETVQYTVTNPYPYLTGAFAPLLFTCSFNGSVSGTVYVSGAANSYPMSEDQTLNGSVINGSVSMTGTTTIDGFTYGYHYDWFTDLYGNDPLHGDYNRDQITGTYSGSLSSGAQIQLTDFFKVVGVDYGFNPPAYIYSSASCAMRFRANQKPCEVKGQFYCFKDVYPGTQGIVYTGPGPNGTQFHASGVGAQDVTFTQVTVQPEGITLQTPSSITNPFVDVFNSDYLHVGPDPAVFSANGDTANYELPVGRAFYWPAFTLHHDQSTTWTPDTWTHTSGVTTTTGDGMISFKVTSAKDSVTGAFNALKWHLGWRYANYTIEAVPDQPGAPVGTVTIHLGKKSYTIAPTGNPVQIDTCEPDNAADAQDGQDSLWPLVELIYNGVTYMVPQRERSHWGVNYVTQIVFDGMTPGVTYTIKQIQPCSSFGMEIECLPQQATPMEYTRVVDQFGITVSDFALRGFRVLIDGRLALEFPWAVYLGSPNNPPASVPIQNSPPNGVQPTANLFDYINSIDGFELVLSNDRSQFFNSAAPLNGSVDDLYAGGVAWDGTTYQDGTTIAVAPQTTQTLYYGCRYDDLDSPPAQGNIVTGANYGDGTKPITYQYAGHFRDRAWSIAWQNGKPLAGANVVATNSATGASGGSGNTRSDGYFETGLPYLLANSTYNLSLVNAQVQTYGRRSDKPFFKTSTSISYDVAQHARHVIAYNDSTVKLKISANGDNTNYIDRDTGIAAAAQAIRWTRDGAQRLKLLTSDGSTVSYQYSYDEGVTWTVPITLGAGQQPAFVVSNSGAHYHYWLSASGSTSNIMGQIRSNNDAVLVDTFQVIGGVDGFGLAVDEHYGAGGSHYIKLIYSQGGEIASLTSLNGVNFT